MNREGHDFADLFYRTGNSKETVGAQAMDGKDKEIEIKSKYVSNK